MNQTNLPTMISYFTGGGLAEAGLRGLFRVVGGVEIDPSIAAHYTKLNPDVDLRVQDVCTVDPSAWEGVSYFHASPSCRNASNAKKDAGETAEDIAAGDAVARGIRSMRPRIFTLENVPGYANFATYKAICDTLTDCGYRWTAQVHNAADFGAPQTRKRLYIRAWIRSEMPPYLVPTHCERKKLANTTHDLFADTLLLPWVGWYEALTHPRYGRDLIPTLPEGKLADWQIKRLPAELTSCLVHGSDMRSMPVVSADMPAFTVMANPNGNGNKPRVILVENLATARDATIREHDNPSFTLTGANCGRRPANMPNILLISDQSGAGGEECGLREGADPSFSVTAKASGGNLPRVMLIDGQQTVPGPNGERIANTRGGDDPALTVCASTWKGMPSVLVHGTSTMELRDSADPSATVCATVHAKAAMPRAVCGGSVRTITPEALARFQMGIFASSYELPEKRKLAAQIIGNGCQCNLQRAVVLSLMEGLS